jgi:hypothetical protein
MTDVRRSGSFSFSGTANAWAKEITRGKSQTPSTVARAPELRFLLASARGGAAHQAEARVQASLALHNLRGLAIAFVVMTHASLAYLASSPAHSFAFDRPPYGWIALPILDARRWLGLDVFCAWQDVHLMSLLFFLSGIFVWPSIERDGALRFLGRRLLRLGMPLAFGVIALMPVALYPVYRLSADNPSLAGYARQYLALPFAPCGPIWFLWVLLALTVIVAALSPFIRPAVLSIGRWSGRFDDSPGRTFAVWALISVAAYAPLALVFTPWRWSNEGPFAIQLCRPLLYALYYCAGMSVGAIGLGRGLLSANGVAARSWAIWMSAAAASLALWMGLTALTLYAGRSAPLLWTAASDASYALAGACSVLFILAMCLRFGSTRRWPLLARLSDNAISLYVLHYAPVVWLQYALLGVDWPPPAKAALVLFGTAVSCMAAIAAARSLRRSVAAQLSSRRAWEPRP